MEEKMGNKTVCLDAGHGGSKPGAVYSGLKEKNINLDVALGTGRILAIRGYNVAYTRTEDIDVSLQDRCKIANAAHADAFISIHCNADPDEDEPGMPEAKGEEILYCKGSQKGLYLASQIAYWIDQIFPDEPFRGVKERDDLYVLKHTNMTAVLIEIGFIDKSSSTESFSDPATIKSICNLIANGIKEAV
jgi:N-acetylmuramoyl-L-alanine amidase